MLLWLSPGDQFFRGEFEWSYLLTPHGAAFTARNVLDALMVNLSVGLITWHLWLRPLVENLDGAAELRSVAGSYFPLVGALQLMLGILALGRAKYRGQLPLTVIVLGLVLLAAGGIRYAQWQSDGSTTTTGFACNMVGNLCTALAPLLVFRAAYRSRRARTVLYPTSSIALQPIVDTATGRIRGTEALLRLSRGSAVADPLPVVAAASRGGILPELTLAVLQHTGRRTSPGDDDSPHPGTIHLKRSPCRTRQRAPARDSQSAHGHRTGRHRDPMPQDTSGQAPAQASVGRPSLPS